MKPTGSNRRIEALMRNIGEGFRNQLAQRIESPQGDKLPFAVDVDTFPKDSQFVVQEEMTLEEGHNRTGSRGAFLDGFQMPLWEQLDLGISTAQSSYVDIPIGEEMMILAETGGPDQRVDMGQHWSEHFSIE
jgi:hypothetical protein